MYRLVFKSLNISIVKLGTEECELCEEFKLHSTVHKEDYLGQDCEVCSRWSLHKSRATAARIEYRKDAESECPQTHVMFSADLEKVIMLPRIESFKTALFTTRITACNETFAPVGTKQGLSTVAVLWHEGVSGRKKEDIISSFYAFFVHTGKPRGLPFGLIIVRARIRIGVFSPF